MNVKAERKKDFEENSGGHCSFTDLKFHLSMARDYLQQAQNEKPTFKYLHMQSSIKVLISRIDVETSNNKENLGEDIKSIKSKTFNCSKPVLRPPKFIYRSKFTDSSSDTNNNNNNKQDFNRQSKSNNVDEEKLESYKNVISFHLSMAQSYLQRAQKDKSRKFINDLLSTVTKLLSGFKSKTSNWKENVNEEPQSKPQTKPFIRPPKFVYHSRFSSITTNNSEETKEYSAHQQAQVKRVLSLKNYHDILGVSKNASITEIKNAYRKLALLLHPDKNRAPGATEAFKALKKAASYLEDRKRSKK